LRIALALLLAACSQTRAPHPPDDPATAAVAAEGAVILHGPIGAETQVPGTYVLVDVTNGSRSDRLITLSGTLVDEAGQPLAKLGAEELRVPAGAARTFALVAEKPSPTAGRATFAVEHAVELDYAPAVVLEQEQFKPGHLPVIAATVRNTVERDATAVVAATFYADGGRILSRPFTVVPLPANASRPVRFEGPGPAAARAVVFVQQVAYHP
jgi:hypothetical protein